jgi:putative SOS response-associated peptidase YedK
VERLDRPGTGEIHSSYTMLTLNCDGHPLLARMHKPDPKLPADQQDKRTAVPLEPADWEQWLNGTVKGPDELRRVPALELYDAGPLAAGGLATPGSVSPMGSPV